jgi:hypothetical protein
MMDVQQQDRWPELAAWEAAAASRLAAFAAYQEAAQRADEAWAALEVRWSQRDEMAEIEAGTRT